MIERVCDHQGWNGECQDYKIYIGGVKGEDIAERTVIILISNLFILLLALFVWAAPWLFVGIGLFAVIAWASLKFPVNYRIVRREEDSV